jgi:hypothetical protein
MRRGSAVTPGLVPSVVMVAELGCSVAAADLEPVA